MEDIGSLWGYQELVDDLKQKLLYTTLELDTVRMEANEEMRKNDENVKNLLTLLKIAYQERDEAKDQLQKLVSKIIIPTSPPEFPSPTTTIIPHHLHHHIHHHQNQLLKPTKPNSSITESNSLSHGSSPVDSFFDPAVSSSPELSALNITAAGDSTNIGFVQEYNNGISSLPPPPPPPPLLLPSLVSPTSTQMKDQASVFIDSLAKGKPLPQKGKLLQAVLEAGPLLQTLLVAGSLPRWRNPPPLQSFKIPPVSITQQKLLNSISPYVEMSCGPSSQMMMSKSTLNFSGGGSSSGPPSSGMRSMNNQITIGKRQRLL